jgi:hypothetical protein
MGWDSGIWTSQENLRLKNSYAVVGQILEAVNERCNASGIDELSSNRLSAIGQIDEKITQIIEAAVNHTDNSGNWEGQTSIPHWTVSDIETAIGESRIDGSRLSEVSVEWAWQQPKIINLLRWFEGEATKESSLEFRLAQGGDWATAVSNFNTEPWSNTDELIAYHDAYFFGQRTIRRNRATAVIENNTDFTVTYQYYIKFYASGSTYENNDYPGISANVFHSVYNNSITSINNDTVDIGNFGDSTVSEPGFLGQRGWVANPFTTGTPDYNIIVAKFDGTNGFTYKDW